jgi:hypothetical protein
VQVRSGDLLPTRRTSRHSVSRSVLACMVRDSIKIVICHGINQSVLGFSLLDCSHTSRAARPLKVSNPYSLLQDHHARLEKPLLISHQQLPQLLAGSRLPGSELLYELLLIPLCSCSVPDPPPLCHVAPQVCCVKPGYPFYIRYKPRPLLQPFGSSAVPTMEHKSAVFLTLAVLAHLLHQRSTGQCKTCPSRC